ncbi:MAG: TraB/GumN family protein [Myxococcota bacterium]
MSTDISDSDNVTILERGETTFYLIGTAHVSEASVTEVQRVIAEVEPDVVCVELCPARYNALTRDDAWKNLNIFKVIREGKTLFLLSNLAIGAYQRRLGEELGVRPGAELLAATEEAKKLGARIELVDRDIHITLKRTWGNLGFLKKVSLLGVVVQSLVSREQISAEDIENLKEQTNLSDMLTEFAKALPEVKKPLIDERDQYLMSGIERAAIGQGIGLGKGRAFGSAATSSTSVAADAADNSSASAESEQAADSEQPDKPAAPAPTPDNPAKKVVAVIGAAHVPGMRENFGKPVDRKALEKLPPPSRLVGALKWLIPMLIITAFSYGYYKNRGASVEDMLFAWILPNSIMAALFTAIAGGKLLSIITAFVASPITSLNPLLGAGMVVGLLEAWLRKPTVDDCENINRDVQNLRGIYRNPVTRVLLVAVMATMGSALGAWIGLSWVVALVA